jgi:hypothetical protein
MMLGEAALLSIPCPVEQPVITNSAATATDDERFISTP